MTNVTLLCMTCTDRLTISDDDVDYATKRLESWAVELGWVRVERIIEGRPKHTADVCETCAGIIHDLVATGGTGRVVRMSSTSGDSGGT